MKARPSHWRGSVRTPAPPANAPARVETRADLRQLQRVMAHALIRPLGRADRLAPRWDNGRPTADIVTGFIKPNDRLSAMERLQIYARCYWYRVTASVNEDCPGLRALLGRRRFEALVRAYLTECRSRSFTLRNLCQRLPEFIRQQPRWSAPHTELAVMVARFEWAQTHAFDAAALPPLEPEFVAHTPPERLRVRLQPHITLLDCAWPVDDYVTAVKRREATTDVASNTIAEQAASARHRHVPLPRRSRTCIVVHRYKNRLFYKREPAVAFAVLSALAAGLPVARAIGAAGPAGSADDIRSWFATWMELGWFCAPETRSAV